MVKANSKMIKKVEIDLVASGGVRKKRGKNRRRRIGRGVGIDTSRSMVPMKSMGLRRNTIPAGYSYQSPSTSLNVNGVTGDFIRIRRCEPFAALLAETADTFDVPAANYLTPARFGWLQGVAASFSKWRWLSLRIYYVPMVGTATNGAIGYGFGYDFAEAAPVVLQDFLAFDQVKVHSSWTTDEAGAVLDTGRFSRDWYSYIGGTAFGSLTITDRNIYAPAYLAAYSGISSATAGSNLGFLWADYVVEMADPISAALQPS